MSRSSRADCYNTDARRSSASSTHSSSSSVISFEFTIHSSDAPSAVTGAEDISPASDLFYRGKILPLHPSPRLRMVKSLLIGSSSASRDSFDSSTSSSDIAISADNYNIESRRPSSVVDLDDDLISQLGGQTQSGAGQRSTKKSKSFTFGKLYSVFKKEPKKTAEPIFSIGVTPSSERRTSAASARDVLKKCVKKVKPLYDTMSRKRKMDKPEIVKSGSDLSESEEIEMTSFSDNMTRRDTKEVKTMSCQLSVRSSRVRPCETSSSSSGSSTAYNPNVFTSIIETSKDSSMDDDLHSAIQGAIAHCKNSMKINKCSASATSTVSNHQL